MYTGFFGLRENPFNATPDPRFLYTNPTISRVIQLLLAGIQERKGFFLLTGEVGTGKSTLLRKLVEELEGTVNFAFCYITTLTFDEILSFCCQDLGLPLAGCNRPQTIQALKEFLTSHYEQGKTTVVLIDEAQNLGEKTLENLQTLLDLETGNEKLLQIVLVGQPELQVKLDHPRLEQLKARLAMRCRLDRLAYWEVGLFIRHRLSTAGYERQELFSQKAIQRIAAYSNGIPRLINIICDNALLQAYAESRKTVSAAIIDEVARDLRLKEELDGTQFKTPEGATAAGKRIRHSSPAHAVESAIKNWWAQPFAGSALARKWEALSKHSASLLAYPRSWRIEKAIGRVRAAGWMKSFYAKSSAIPGRMYSETIRILPGLVTKMGGRWALVRDGQGTWAAVVIGLLALFVLWGTRPATDRARSGAALQAYSAQESARTKERARVVTAPELGFAVSGRGAQDSNRSFSALVRDGEADFSRLHALYEQELLSDPSLMGSMVLDLTIEPDGKPSRVDFLSMKMRSPKLRAVVSRLVSTWRFSSASGPVRIHYPILFVPPGIDAASIVAWEKSTTQVKTKLPASRSEPYLAEIKEPGAYRVVLLTHVRSRPRDEAEIIASLKPATRVWVERVLGRYLEVLAPNGNRIHGYIHREDAFLAAIE